MRRRKYSYCIPDGSKRARRNGRGGLARKQWYAKWRTIRFAKKLLG